MRAKFVFEEEQDARLHKMKFSDKEKRTILAVFDSLMKKNWEELNTFLGSETIKEMWALYWRIEDEWKYGAYCKARGIRVDQMTDEDYENAVADEWLF